ncbi:MAG: thiol-disulfide isomerase/thioredoxin domain-containing protein [Chlorobi bacterium OLB5]|nr:MAG: thiol-disulfide isomerase/thioredoxin domain-containing protein [Chlorobi bacterium OLB5]
MISKIFIPVFILIMHSGLLFAGDTFEDVLKKASTENKRIVIDVYTDWCGWCKKMDAEAYSNKEVKKLIEENFVLYKLDAEGKNKLTYNGKQYTEEELSYYFEVFSFPTTVFLEPDGKLITFSYDNYPMKNIPGYVKTDEFKKLLIYFKDGKYKDTDLSKII